MASFYRELPIFALDSQLRLPAVALGKWPTPIDEASALQAACDCDGNLFLKRDDLSSPLYGGNKVRCLEFLFAEALEAGASHIEATGAFGTNHGVATALHAPRVGLDVGATIFPQPMSAAAAANLRVLGENADPFFAPHWSVLPLAAAIRHVSLWRSGRSPYWMVPGGATPRGALAYASAALELAHQVRAKELPLPRAIVVGAGSTCTAAGLLCGLLVARRVGLIEATPRVVAVRVTPWPATAKSRIVELAWRTGQEWAKRSGESSRASSLRELAASLEVDGSELGAGYGRATSSGLAAIASFRKYAGIELDTTYSAKVAAAFLVRAKTSGPVLFWSSKSTAPLPASDDPSLPRAAARWLAHAEET